MGTIYVIGAGFSKTCGIATDVEMLDALEPLLKKGLAKDGTRRSTIAHLLEQNFRSESHVGFERFMSTLASLKFSAEYLQAEKNIFRREEREVRNALTRYLTKSVQNMNWDSVGAKAVQRFIQHVNWHDDLILTFNYDLLIETTARHLGVNPGDRIVHLHGAVGESNLAWPTYTKFAYRRTKLPLAPRWERAFRMLRRPSNINAIVFIGYSMPPTDLEARGLFNYTDWYNSSSKGYRYEVIVVNPSDVRANYCFYRNSPRFIRATMADWLSSDANHFFTPKKIAA